MTSEDFNVDQWETHIVREVDEWIKDTHYWMHVCIPHGLEIPPVTVFCVLRTFMMLHLAFS